MCCVYCTFINISKVRHLANMEDTSSLTSFNYLKLLGRLWSDLSLQLLDTAPVSKVQPSSLVLQPWQPKKDFLCPSWERYGAHDDFHYSPMILYIYIFFNSLLASIKRVSVHL